MMGKENRIKKGIYSFIKKIDEHFIKYEEAKILGNLGRLNYYNKEIEQGFFRNIDKAMERLGGDVELEGIILLRKQHRNEIKIISLSQTNRGT